MNSVKRGLVTGIIWLAGVVSILAPVSVTGQTGGYDSPYFQADMVQEISEWSASLINPALLYRVNQFHLTFYGGYRWSAFADGLGFQNMSFLMPVRRNQTLGLGVIFTNSNIVLTDIDPLSSTIINKGTSSFGDAWIVGSYAARFPMAPWFMLGGNLKYRIVKQFDRGYGFNKNGIPGVDLGVYLNPVDHYRFGDLGFSLTLQELIPVKIEWKGEGTTGEPGSQLSTSRLRLGLRYAAINDQLVIDMEGIMENVWADVLANMGVLDPADVEFSNATQTYDLIQKAYRGSFHLKYQFIPQVWIKAGWNNNNIPYLGLNLNFIYPLPEMINYINLDMTGGYSFIEYLLKDNIATDERGFTGMMKLSTDFGYTREQRESKRLYDKLILAPMDAYQEAMRLYTAGRYWEAGFAFGKVISLFPNFHLNDKATYYMGNCYRFLYMNSIARETYKQALEEFTTSDERAKYLYGLEALDFREAKFDDALKNHAFIVNLYPESEIRPDADYLAGEVHFERKNYNVAEQLFSGIQRGTVPYMYGQYTLSIINIENEKTPAAIQNLMNVVKDTTQDPAVLLLQDAANLKLGHLYFEQGDQLRQAVEAYSRVPDGSPYGDEALLGTAWAWIKVNKPDICLQTIDRLISAHPESPLIPEAYLVKGYSLMLLKRYTEAVAALETSLELTKKTFVTEQDLENRKRQFERYVQDFLPTADMIRKNALRKPTDKTVEQRGELKTEFDKFARENTDFFNYVLLERSHRKFFKQKDQVVSDAEYALAKATNLLKGRKQIEVQKDIKQKEEKLDTEIERLKRQLEGIE